MDAMQRRLADALIPGHVVEFEREDAEQVGAFVDDAITIEDALANTPDLLHEVP